MIPLFKYNFLAKRQFLICSSVVNISVVKGSVTFFFVTFVPVICNHYIYPNVRQPPLIVFSFEENSCPEHVEHFGLRKLLPRTCKVVDGHLNPGSLWRTLGTSFW